MTLLDRLRRALLDEDRRHLEWWHACARRREARQRARVFAWEVFCGLHRSMPAHQVAARLAGHAMRCPAKSHPSSTAGSPDS